MSGMETSRKIGWAVLGPGGIAVNFAQGLAECGGGRLVAVAGRDAGRRDAFGRRFGLAAHRRHAGLDSLLGDMEVEAVYIATPHPFHAELAIRAMRAGRHVLVEKPAGLVPGEVVAMTEVAARQGVFLMEGLMYRCHPQIRRLVEIIRSGDIGEVRHIEASFGFASTFEATSRLDCPELGGGAILDVGVYPVSLARLVAGAARGAPFDEPVRVEGMGRLGPAGADETSYALLLFQNGIVAECSASIRRELANTATVTGTIGSVHLPDPWVPGRDSGPSDAVLEIRAHGVSRRESLPDPRILFAHEAESASRRILSGFVEAESPAPSWRDSIGTAEVTAAWRRAVGYELPVETPGGLRVLPGVVPAGLPDIPRVGINGMEGKISALIMGCDNRDTLAEGAIVWDAWWEAGGNGFDTGFVYGGGHHEALLGQWLKVRGVAREAKVIVKGAHSPYCLPDVIRAQLEISLERLGLERAPVYIMHRDNTDVPVGEFVEALNVLNAEGLIGAFGGSNWTVDRIRKANAYALANSLKPMEILNNNLSLAVMEKPVWPGCVTSNDAGALAFLRKSGITHLSWSSQARGYFLDPSERSELPEGTAPDICFASTDNLRRRERAKWLAAEMGVLPHNIAMAWVLEQAFPSLALIGPRSPGEIVSTISGLGTVLSERDLAWLNLEEEFR